MKYIFGTMKQKSLGIWHMIQIFKPEMIFALCISLLKVSKNSEHICNESYIFDFDYWKNNISEYDVKKLGTRWGETFSHKWKEVATVTILWMVLEKKTYFWSGKLIVSRTAIFTQSREETSFTSLTTTIFKPPVDPGDLSQKISIQKWRQACIIYCTLFGMF